MSIDDIARGLGQPDEAMRLTVPQAISLLEEKTSKTSDMFKYALNSAQTLTNLVHGQATITEFRECTEGLTVAADDVLNLVCAILEAPAVDRADFYGHELALMETIDYINAAYKLRDAVRSWNSGAKSQAILEAATEFAQLSHAAYRSASMFETNAGGNTTLAVDPTDLASNQPSKIYDQALLECVSTGAIAIRPAFVQSSKKQPADIFPKRNKRRWYHKYVIER